MRDSGAENRTGIPTQLKERMEQHTGLSLNDVRVHYHSDLPARLDALAYTQGNQVYIGAGQERHLPHELGHVVQQKLGKVRADTRHESGVLMNTDAKLEREADEIGALQGALQGGLHERTNGNSYDGDASVQRKIKPQSEELDNGALIGFVRGRMNKKYKDAYRNQIVDFYRRMRESSYPFTNEEILENIVTANWNHADTGELLAAEMEQEKQAELDRRYGGERGHMVSRHIEISDEDLRARVEGARGIPRASAFAPGIKGKDQALYSLEKLQPVLENLLRDVMQRVGNVLVRDMEYIKDIGKDDVIAYLSNEYGIDFNTEMIEENGEFTVHYQYLLQKKRQEFTLTVDYSVEVDRIFQKLVREKDRPGKARRAYEAAHVYRGRNKPCIKVDPATTEADIENLVEQSGIDLVGVTFY
ncbi:MAG: DUF4157 domain-containing protein [Lachnospiraceae bacterium]|nr:DUF4157 domain-containing protein [Lachnospiraceae bacterium]MDE7239073.1 DUF4157 domain-containing protein [Lachnospiraceae bacterium]